MVLFPLTVYAGLRLHPTRLVYASTTTLDDVYMDSSIKYQVDIRTLLKLKFCESGIHGMKARGDGGRAYGIFQYHLPTWERFSKEYGEKLDINSEWDQVKLTAWALSKGYANHWYTCSKKIGII